MAVAVRTVYCISLHLSKTAELLAWGVGEMGGDESELDFEVKSSEVVQVPV